MPTAFLGQRVKKESQDSLAGEVQMVSLGLLDYQVAKAIMGFQAIHIPSLVLMESVVSLASQALQADQEQLAILGQEIMDLLDLQEVREMLEYLACQDSRDFQAKKGNLATSTSKDFLDHQEIKDSLAYWEAQVIRGHQVPQDHQVFQDRKGKEAACQFLDSRGYQEGKVKRGSQDSQAPQLGAFRASQVHKVVLVILDIRVRVALGILAFQGPEGVQVKMEILGQLVIQGSLADLEIQDQWAIQGFKEKREEKVL